MIRAVDFAMDGDRLRVATVSPETGGVRRRRAVRSLEVRRRARNRVPDHGTRRNEELT
jgi:hypothetical protein